VKPNKIIIISIFKWLYLSHPGWTKPTFRRVIGITDLHLAGKLSNLGIHGEGFGKISNLKTAASFCHSTEKH